MATSKQKEAARRNIGKARQARSARAPGKNVPRHSEGMSTADKDRLEDQEFAFPAERKEPLIFLRNARLASPARPLAGYPAARARAWVTCDDDEDRGRSRREEWRSWE